MVGSAYHRLTVVYRTPIRIQMAYSACVRPTVQDRTSIGSTNQRYRLGLGVVIRKGCVLHTNRCVTAPEVITCSCKYQPAFLSSRFLTGCPVLLYAAPVILNPRAASQRNELM